MQEQLQKHKAWVVSAPACGLPPKHSVLEVLYGSPSSESQRRNPTLPSYSSSTSTLMETQRILSHHHIASMPGFEQSVSIRTHLSSGQRASPHPPPGIHEPLGVSLAPPPCSTCGLGLTDNPTAASYNYDILGPYPNFPSNHLYLS
jgi:hypothetical protein